MLLRLRIQDKKTLKKLPVKRKIQLKQKTNQFWVSFFMNLRWQIKTFGVGFHSSKIYSPSGSGSTHLSLIAILTLISFLVWNNQWAVVCTCFLNRNSSIILEFKGIYKSKAIEVSEKLGLPPVGENNPRFLNSWLSIYIVKNFIDWVIALRSTYHGYSHIDSQLRW